MKVHAWLATVVLLAGGVAFAQTATPAPKDPLATPRIDAREARQQKRIAQGLASGRLTEREANRLQKGEARIDRVEDKAKADGAVSAKEREHLTRMQNRENQAIFNQKHDPQRDMNHDGQRDHRQGGQHAGSKK